MKKPHKHAELIKAWADGAVIQYRYNANIPWHDATSPQWWEYECEYRIKPEPKPDLIYYGVFDMDGSATIDSVFTKFFDHGDHIKVTFCGETGKLKSAEVL